MYHEIEIKQSSITPMGTEIYLDGKRIKGVREIGYDLGLDRVATVRLEIVPERCNIHEEVADIELSVDIDSLTTAMRCILYETKLNEDFRKAIIGSASSVLIESGIDKAIAEEFGERIIERIFEGEE